MNPNAATCSHDTVIADADVIRTLWTIYCAAFGDAGNACIQEQLCYGEETFAEAMRDPAYHKFVVRDGTEPVGFFLCTNDLEKARVAYVNPKRLLAQFPEYAGRIWYFTAIAIRPDRQGKRYTWPLVVASTAFMDEQQALVAFDFSTEKNPSLPEFLMRGMEAAQAAQGMRTKKSEYVPLGGQQYGVIKMS